MTRISTNEAYQTITDQIVAGMETAQGNWKAGWARLGLPVNASGVPYNGLNIIVLFMSASTHGYNYNEWGTYNAWKKRGACVKAGEKATTRVLKWVNVPRRDENGEKTDKTFLVPRAYPVFNIDQVKGAEPRSVPVKNDVEAIEHCEEYINATLADIRLGGDSAHYTPAKDEIAMPHMYSFRSAQAFYATCFHELIHWSGSDKRLDRLKVGAKSTRTDYAYEELIAELGSAFLCSDHGVVEDDARQDHIEYISSWIKLLKSDPKAIFNASREARKAKEFLDKTVQETLKEAGLDKRAA